MINKIQIVVLPGLEPGPQASEARILSIILQDQYFNKYNQMLLYKTKYFAAYSSCKNKWQKYEITLPKLQ